MSNQTEETVVEVAREVRKPRPLDRSKYRFVTVEEITTPRNGRICYVDHWWHVTDDTAEVMFWKVKGSYGTPQCNSNRSVVEHLRIEGCTPILLRVAYLPHDCRDYA